MNGYIYLIIAIIAEVIATVGLKWSAGFSRLLPSILVIIGYCIAFWGLSQVVKTIPLGIAYAIWSGMGVVLVSIAALFLYQQKLDWPALIGILLILSGVLMIHSYSTSVVS